MRWPVILLLFVIVAAVPCQASNLSPRFEHLTIDDGLPENSVRSILQDRQGFLWFGTHNGLARYDGYDMEIFLPVAGDSSSIFPRFLIALAEDETGSIWIGSYSNGLSRFDPQTHRFTNFLPDPTDPTALPGHQVVAIEPSEEGVWVALGDGGLARFDGEGFQRVPIQLVDGPQDLSDTPNLSALLITENRIWAGTERQGLLVRDRRGGPWRLFRHDPQDPRSLPTNMITDLHQDDNGRTWVSTRSGLALYRGGNDFQSFIPTGPTGQQSPNNYLVCMDSDSAGDLWIGSAVGLYHFSPSSQKFTLFAHDPKNPHSPVLGPALSVLIDRSGIVWAGSWHTGLNKFDPWSLKFEIHLHDDSEATSLDDDAVVSLFEDQAGVLWVGTGSLSSGGTTGGLNYQAPGETGFRHMAMSPEAASEIRRINSIVEDKQKKIWLGSNLGLWCLNEERNQVVRPVELDPGIEPLTTGSTISMLLDRRDRLWVSFWEAGLHRYDPADGSWKSYWHDPRDSTSLKSNQLSALCMDDRGRIWVGTDQAGLHLYDESRDAFQSFHSTVSGTNSITNLLPATDGRVWVASSAGVLLVSTENWIEWTFTSADGLPSDFLGRIQDDPQGLLWVSTARGLVRLNPQTGEHSVFDRRDGLPRNELYFASLMSSDGRMMFGGHHGMISFRPDEVHSNPYVPPVVLVDFEVDDQSLSVGGGLTLASGFAKRGRNRSQTRSKQREYPFQQPAFLPPGT